MTYREHMRRCARAYLEDLIEKHPRVGEAARVAGTNRTHLYRLLEVVGLAERHRRLVERDGERVYVRGLPRAPRRRFGFARIDA